jgi:tetratricopeptide (TPR) repeat protein
VLTASEHLRAVTPIAAQDPQVRVFTASAHLRLGDSEAALALTEGAEPPAPHVPALRDLTRGEAFLGLGRLDQALATAAAALDRDRTGVPVEFVVSLHTLRAQALNQRKEFTAARDAAGAAIAAAGDASPIGGFSAFVRLAALMQRSLSLYRLGDVAAAQRDVDAAITGFERLRGGTVLRMMAQVPDFARFETSLWFAKGALLDADSRTDEALAAYTRAQRLERHGNVAAVARGYALPKAALEFVDALPESLADERTLLFNRALALDALGRRRAAINTLVRARDAGLERAQQELDRLDAPAGLGRWTHHWFGGQARPGRRIAGSALLAAAATGLAAPLLQWWVHRTLDWYLLLLPSMVALVLLALPSMKSITVEAGKLKLTAEPLPATARETAAGPAPESFSVPILGSSAVASHGTLSADIARS